MNIEVRRVLEYKPGCNRIQFYITQPNPRLFSLIQVLDEDASVTVEGSLILELAGLKPEDTCFIYFVGITEDKDLFTFEPHQEVKMVDQYTKFVFKGVELCWNEEEVIDEN